MNVKFQEIKNQIQILKKTAGIYFWKNKKGEFIYIGKASDLQKRLLSYLKENSLIDVKTKRLQAEIDSVDWIVTRSEVEALLLEAVMIKKHKPKFNVRLKDDKKYPYICVSISEDYPRVFITRNTNQKSNLYFGPYSDVKTTRFIVDFIHKIFPIRKKNLKLPLKTPQRPCLNFYMNRCFAPCQGNVDIEKYQKIVSQVIQFLKGEKKKLMLYLEQKMQIHAEEMEFEMAIRYRDIREKIKKTRSKQNIYNISEEEMDVLAFCRKEEYIEAVLIEFRERHLETKKVFSLTESPDCKNSEIVYAFMRDYYLNIKYLPSTILLSHSLEKEEETKFLDFFQKKFQKIPKIIVPKRGLKLDFIKMAEKNAEKTLSERILSDKMKDKSTTLQEMKIVLNLKEVPKHIECFDVSHFHAQQPFGSCVVFKNGVAATNEYRIFGIRAYQQVHDPGMIHETLSRRIQFLLNENLSLPNLIVIDGGITQLNKAFEVLESMNLSKRISMIGLAKKREEVYFPHQNQPYNFEKNLSALRLLRQIRDESHRFAIKHHRKKRDKKLFQSIFTEIEGIGTIKKKKILSSLKSIEDISSLSTQDLMKVEGIGKKLAEKIIKKLYLVDQ